VCVAYAIEGAVTAAAAAVAAAGAEARVSKEFNCQRLSSGCYRLTAAELALNTQ